MWSIIALLVAVAISGVFIAKTRKIGVDYTMLRNTVPDLKVKVCSLNALTLAAKAASENGVDNLEDIDEEASANWNEFKNYVENVSKSSVTVDPDKYATMTQVVENDSIIQEDCSGVDLSVMIYKDEDNGKYYLVSKASDGKKEDFSWAIGKSGGSGGNNGGNNGNGEGNGGGGGCGGHHNRHGGHHWWNWWNWWGSGDDEDNGNCGGNHNGNGGGGNNGTNEDVEINVPPSHEDPIAGKDVDINVSGSGGYVGKFTGVVRTNRFRSHYVYGITSSEDVNVNMENLSGNFAISDFENCVKIFGTGHVTGIFSNDETKLLANTVSGNVYVNRFKGCFDINGNGSLAGIVSKSFEFNPENMSSKFYVNYWENSEDITLPGNSHTCGIVTKDGDLKFDLKDFSGEVHINYFQSEISANSNSWLYGMYSSDDIDLKGDNYSGRFSVNEFSLSGITIGLSLNGNAIGIFSKKDTKIDGISNFDVNDFKLSGIEMSLDIGRNLYGIYAENGNLEIKNSNNVTINSQSRGFMFGFSLGGTGNVVGMYSGKDMNIDGVNGLDVNNLDLISVWSGKNLYGMYTENGNLEIKNSKNIRVNSNGIIDSLNSNTVAAHSGKDLKLSNVDTADFYGWVLANDNLDITDSVNVDFAGRVYAGGDLNINNTSIAKFHKRTCVNGDLDIDDSNDVDFYGRVCVKGDLNISNSNVTFYGPVYVKGRINGSATFLDGKYEGKPCPDDCNSSVDDISIDVDISGCAGGVGGSGGGTSEGTGVSWEEVGG